MAFSRSTQPPDFPDATSPAPLELLPPKKSVVRSLLAINMFWRTFILLAVLLLGSMLAWLKTMRELEFEPRALQTAQQIAALVNLSRAALQYADPIARVSLLKAMAEQERVRIAPHEPKDVFVPLDDDALSRRIVAALESRLGAGTVVASSVNGEPGLWVGFTINGDPNWLHTDRERFNPGGGRTWLVWLLTTGGVSLAGAALIAGLINRPLKRLLVATSRVREGDFDAGQLDEGGVTGEIREVNIGFNRMAQRLAKIEQDRVVMLAGISHDLRTPLARLRLETEMSVADADARAHMVADIEQLDRIIDKFLDYARPDHIDLKPVSLNKIIEACCYAVRDHEDMRIHVQLPEPLVVMSDATELARVLSNLLENARRYGKTPGTDVAEIDIAAKPRDEWVLIKVRDRGPGVSESQLADLSKPFFRGDTARTAATGAGLGLSIVDTAILRMGGVFQLANTRSGGLAAHIKLRRALR
ncbi:sensor histidine kinase [Pseudorhodoferax sp. Leaf274]|uniref:sensor histidine kinase n=1 Tax=Pseudorhodoferax sp. Leaf274 TaxID=1736318 RepID=UPI000A6EF4EC|nr:sensor histidine kinase [Pseudorhodoferax sp. Leaf274]